jgi:hypothetical protein
MLSMYTIFDGIGVDREVWDPGMAAVRLMPILAQIKRLGDLSWAPQPRVSAPSGVHA